MRNLFLEVLELEPFILLKTSSAVSAVKQMVGELQTRLDETPVSDDMSKYDRNFQYKDQILLLTVYCVHYNHFLQLSAEPLWQYNISSMLNCNMNQNPTWIDVNKKTTSTISM